jgi:hypothetical protein
MLRLRRLFGELDYAQRRMLELRTGQPFTGPRPASPRAAAEIDRLDAAWAATGGDRGACRVTA